MKTVLDWLAEDIVNGDITEQEAENLRENLSDEDHEYLWLKVEELWNG